MFSAQRQDRHIGLAHGVQCCGKAALVCPGDGVTIGVQHLGAGQTELQLFQKARAIGLLAGQNFVKLCPFVRLNLGAGHKAQPCGRGDGAAVALHPGDGTGHGVDGFHHAQVGISTKELAGAGRVRPDDRHFGRALQRQYAVVFEQDQRLPRRLQRESPTGFGRKGVV